MRKRKFFICTVLLLPWILSGCGDIVPVWVGTVEVKDYYLYYTDAPQEFDISLYYPEPNADFRLEMEVTYQIGGVGRNELPLTLILEGASLPSAKEFPVTIPLKENGEWAGETKENKVDKVVTHTVIPSITLPDGEYVLKVYANDEKEEKIHGIIRLSARLYANEPDFE